MRIKTVVLLLFVFLIGSKTSYAKEKNETDRTYWANLCYKISAPVLENMSKGELRKNMQLELSPIWDTWDGNIPEVAYMEAFGRLMAGIAPWLSLEPDNTKEGKMRAQLLEWALKSYKHAVDPESPDYLLWVGPKQPLVDAAYLAQSFIRAPKTLWEPLDDATKARYIFEFKRLRTVQPPYNNWWLFRGTVEAFLAMAGEDIDGFAVEAVCRQVNNWYVGDGYYTDGPLFAQDYYNSYVMHSMFLEMVETLESKNIKLPISSELILRRMQRYNDHLERLISPEGTYPAIGRSVTYRLAAFQPLAMSAWKYGLPSPMSNGQIRAALTKVMKNMFSFDNIFTKDGFLSLGFVGKGDNLADYYTNTGSLYMTSLVFMPLALPANHDFWTAQPEEWTQLKAWSNKPIHKDYAESIVE